jgi:hypothetical protein
VLKRSGDCAEPKQSYREEMDISFIEEVTAKWMKGLVLWTRMTDSIVLE